MEKSLLEERFLIIEDNLKRIREEIGETAISAGRNPQEIRLMAVTKTVEPVFINHALACGIDLIGENKVQEFIGKADELKLEGCEVHLIGHLQTNKVRQIVGKVNMIQSVDSVKLADEIGKRSAEKGLTTNILLEINIAKEETKFGLFPEQVLEIIYEISEISGVKVCGLMSVPPIFEDSEKNRSFFSNMHHLFIDIREKKIDNVSMDILSLGMSGDYKQAIMEGSNLIRIGSAIFGARIY
jgi:pyridoxal phosphate enzyme (YggS family)